MVVRAKFSSAVADLILRQNERQHLTPRASGRLQQPSDDAYINLELCTQRLLDGAKRLVAELAVAPYLNSSTR